MRHGVILINICVKTSSVWTASYLFEKEVINVLYCKGKGKGTVHPRTGHEGPEGEYRYSSILSLTSVLGGVDGQCHIPAAFPPGKTLYQLYRVRGGPQCRSGRVQKISPPPGFDPRTVQPTASRYTG